jgi:hypothetical protein
MAALLLLLAIIGASVVADLVVENTGTGAITVLHHPIIGYRDGLLLAMAAALGLVIGLLVVGSLSLRRTRRARRRQLRVTERELRGQLPKLEGENTRLRTVPPPLANHQAEPIDEEARRVARLRSSFELSLPSMHR